MQNYSPIYPYPNAYAMPQNPYQQIPQPIVQPQNDGPIMAWVQGGINGAKSYPVPPNQRAYLFDSEDNTFYVKDVDQNGMPKPLRAFDYTERIIEEEQPNNTSNFVTRDEIKDIIKEALSENNYNRKGGYHNGKSSVRGTNESRNEGDVR